MSIAEMNGPAPANIEALINMKGLKKAAVAEWVNMSAQDLSGILAGRRLMKINELLNFARALGVEPNDLLRPRAAADAVKSV